MQSFLDFIRDFGIQVRKELIHLLWTEQERTILYVRPFVLFRECYCASVIVRRQELLLFLCGTRLLFSPWFVLMVFNFGFIVNWMDIPSSKQAITRGGCNSLSIFGNGDL